MKNLNKKILAIILVLVVAIGGIFVVQSLLPQTVQGAKKISITLVNEMEDPATTVFENKEYQTDAETLGAFLDEVKDELKIEIGCETSEYGRCLESIASLNGDLSSATGPWILYESENNESCSSAGYCPGIDDLAIANGDTFNFKYTDSYE